MRLDSVVGVREACLMAAASLQSQQDDGRRHAAPEQMGTRLSSAWPAQSSSMRI
jgi:hypothetical protein